MVWVIYNDDGTIADVTTDGIDLELLADDQYVRCLSRVRLLHILRKAGPDLHSESLA